MRLHRGYFYGIFCISICWTLSNASQATSGKVQFPDRVSDRLTAQHELKVDRNEYKLVNAFVDANLYEDARKELLEIIKKNPEQRLKVPQNLLYLLESDFDPSLGRFDKQFYEWNLLSIGQIKFWSSLILSIVVIFITICALTRWILENLFRQKLYLDIKDFNDEATTLKIGKGATVIIKSLLIKSNELGTNPELTIALEPIEKFESPIEINQLATLLKLVNWLFLFKSFKLSGYCQQSKRGIGLTLVLKSYRGVSTQTFWQKDYDPSLKISKEVTDLYKLLAIPASIWLLSKLNDKALRNWLLFDGYNECESYAYSRIGIYWYKKGDIPQSQEMLCKSLAYNQNNRFALLTLGVIKIQQAVETEDPKLLNEASEILHKAKDISILKRKGNSGDEKNPISPVWYKAMFQLLALEQYEESMFQARSNDGNAEKLGSNLISAIEYRQKNTRSETQEKLKEFLDEFEVSARIVYASILINSKYLDQDKIQINKIKKTHRTVSIDSSGDLFFKNNQDNSKKPIIDCLVYYNFACYYALCIQKRHQNLKEKGQDIDTDTDYKDLRDKIFCYLKYAIKQNKSLVTWLVNDPSFYWITKESKLASDFYQIIFLSNHKEL